MLAVIVIDCGERTIIRDLAAKGRMPAWVSLAERGAVVPLSSDAHILDGSVFQTLLTGVNPGRHGIYKYRQLVPGTYRYARSKGRDSPVPQLWNVLSARGRRCCVFDVPKSYPTDVLRGRMMTAWGAYSPGARQASIPPGLRRHVLRRFGPHPQLDAEPVPLRPAAYEAVRDRLIEGARTRAELCRWMLGGRPWDFFATAFCESHVAAHQFWNLRNPAQPTYDAESTARCGDAIERVYEAIDASVVRLLDALPEDSTVVVLTQQGVGDNFSGSHLLPEWLARRQGRSAYGGPRRVIRLAGRLGPRVGRLLRRMVPVALTDRWLKYKYRGGDDVFMLAGSEFMALLRVNLRGREPRGSVSPDRYRPTIEALRDDLRGLLNPATGGPAVAEVVFVHDVFSGPLVETLPDVLVRWQNDAPIEALECPKHGRIARGLKFRQPAPSSHTGEGLAVVAGPAIPHRRIEQRRPVQDLTATLFRLAGEEPPKHLEGTAIPLR